MDHDPSSESPRKVKFAPKGPLPANLRNPRPPKSEDDVEAVQRALLCRVEVISLSLSLSLSKIRASVQVVFSHGVVSTPSRTFGKPRERTKDKSETGDAEEVAFDNGRISFTSPSTDKTEVEETCTDPTNAGIRKKKKKEYMEPWDYEHGNYFVTLPLRRPYSGDPELLDEAEFEEGAEYDENTLCSAKDLGLLDQGDASKMLLFQFPANLPLDRVNSRTNRVEELIARRYSINQMQIRKRDLVALSDQRLCLLLLKRNR